ncbi:hypothetical protein pb186bvf_001514 [Paramecium bursaria]
MLKQSFSTIKSLIEHKLQVFNPLKLEVINESQFHSVPKNSETHFKIIITSEQFIQMPYIKRHQQIYKILDDIKVHALQIQARSPNEDLDDLQSPKCLGGSKKQN